MRNLYANFCTIGTATIETSKCRERSLNLPLFLLLLPAKVKIREVDRFSAIPELPLPIQYNSNESERT
jgi:hypothetical protein